MLEGIPLPELTRRQEDILALVVQSYTQQPEPVSSKLLCERYDLSVSSATVRNEMAVLEELGYLAAPHTSAGRVPTERGYRYVVRRLLADARLGQAEQAVVAQRFQQLPLALETWLRAAATQLARMAHTAALVTTPVTEVSRFKHVELIAIQGRLALMVLVLHGGVVRQQMLTLVEPLAQEALSEAAARVNAVCINFTRNELRLKMPLFGALERDVVELAAEQMQRADSRQAHVVYRDGLSEALPAFTDTGGAQQALRVLEESALLNLVLDELVPPTVDHVQVIIAGEGRWEELRHLSMVVSRYGVAGQAVGALGVVGPTHLNYGRAVGVVRAVSTLLSDMMGTLYRDTDDAPPAFLPGPTPPSQPD